MSLETEVDGAARVKGLLAEISGVPVEQISWYVYVLANPDGNLVTGTNAAGRESVHTALSRAAEEWPQ